MPDIFFSYAHVDDQSFAEGEKGWITHFSHHLRTELNRRMGRRDNYSFWQDFRLRGNDGVTPEIEQQVTQANTLLILFSQGWLASPWCQKELEIFRDTHPDVGKRIFVVELERMEQDDKPSVMRDLLSFPFWRQTDKERVRQLGYPVPQKTDSEYFDRLVDLSHDLARTLKTLQTSAQPQGTPKATVYVAPVNDSLYAQRQSVINELRQFGIEVLPGNNVMDSNMDAALAKCSHFVQLLDTNWAFGIPCNQYFTAEVAKKPILQWRDPKLDYLQAGIFDDQKKLLEGKTVIACPLPDFIRQVREVLLPEPPKPKPVMDAAKKMIFVHTGQDDFERARCVANTLQQQGYGIVLPSYQGTAIKLGRSSTL